MAGEPGRPEASKTLDRGIRVLEMLARREHSRGRTITELSTDLGVGRPAVYRLVATLEEHHLVSRQADGRVRMGLGMSRLAAAVTPIVRSEARLYKAALANMPLLPLHTDAEIIRVQLRQNLALQHLTPAHWHELEPLLEVADYPKGEILENQGD